MLSERSEKRDKRSKRKKISRINRKIQGSMTVEASLVVPIFLFAMILTGYLAQMAYAQDEVQWVITRIAREASAEYGATGKKALISNVAYKAKLLRYLDKSVCRISLLKSEYDEKTDEILIVANYRMNLPFRFIPDRMCNFESRVRTRAFTGVEDRGLQDKELADITVYVTETGRVYHRSLKCTYLKLSISEIKGEDLEYLRNESGGVYKPCEKCCKSKVCGKGEVVWITNFGDRYHTNRACSGLKRKIRTIRLADAAGRTPCGKCALEN